ncbi:hypothetical protein, partial [Pseudomonas syringae group genomosp. 7]|uniref:hypothetical protein n=1 Tax=Pseudomonas syringae group genomosp. 7 TaxID=251699 RepID=UPI00377037F1
FSVGCFLFLGGCLVGCVWWVVLGCGLGVLGGGVLVMFVGFWLVGVLGWLVLWLVALLFGGWAGCGWLGVVCCVVCVGVVVFGVVVVVVVVVLLLFGFGCGLVLDVLRSGPMPGDLGCI